MGLFSKKKTKEKRSAEWIKQALEKIEELKPRQVSEPDPGIRYMVRRSDTIPDRTDFEIWKSQLRFPTFQEMLMTCIEKKHMSNKEFYKAALIDRKLFSAIKNNRHYKPKKETAVACCFGLKLCLSDSEKLLELAGYKLSLAITWDRVVYYCLKNNIVDIDDVNELLYAEGEKCIRVS
ncbi:MAG: hypothetical protein E7242_04370 [Lachnospiraceae bacterium]|nr:hypothetical protein [Lachnospiraceae bacterium]